MSDQVQNQKQQQTQQQKQQQNQKADQSLFLLEQERRCIEMYRKTLRTFIMTSRFNEKTRQENEAYRQKRNLSRGCLYCTPELVAQDIPSGANMIVLEMNNDTNRIMAMGLLTNTPHFQKYNVYDDTNYNRFSYVGKYRIRREEMTEDQEKIIQALDRLCFKGNQHMKRGHGLKSFPVKILWRCKRIVDLVEFMENLFKEKIHQKI